MGNSNENTTQRPVAIHRIYSEMGGSKVCGNFGLSTPAKLDIQECVLVSQCGQHKAKFADATKLAQKDTSIRVTHGESRGLVGNLDATAKALSGNPKASGWTWWRVVDAPEWFRDSLAQKVADRESGKATADEKKSEAKAKRTEAATRLDPDLPKFSPAASKAKAERLAKEGQGTAAASMGGLEE